MNGWGGGNDPMPNYVGGGTDGGALGVGVGGVGVGGVGVGGVGGGVGVGGGSARTAGKLSVTFHNQLPDNAQPGPSTVTSPKLFPKYNRVTGARAKGVQMLSNTSNDRLATEETDSSSLSTEDAQRRSRQILVGWDTFRSRTMLILLVMLVIWAAIYFPLILT